MIIIRIKLKESLTDKEIEDLAKETDSPTDFVEALLYDYNYNLKDGSLEHLDIVDYDSAEAYWKEVNRGRNKQEWDISNYDIEDVSVSLGSLNINIEFSNSIPGEARTERETVYLSSKFLSMVDQYGENSPAVLELLFHELGHLLHENSNSVMGWIEKNPENALGRYNKVQGFWDGISYNPTESFAQAVGMYYARPSDLRTNFPTAFQFIDTVQNQLNLDRLADKISDEYSKFLEKHYY